MSFPSPAFAGASCGNPTVLPNRYEAFLYIEASQALQPLPTLASEKS